MGGSREERPSDFGGAAAFLHESPGDPLHEDGVALRARPSHRGISRRTSAGRRLSTSAAPSPSNVSNTNETVRGFSPRSAAASRSTGKRRSCATLSPSSPDASAGSSLIRLAALAAPAPGPTAQPPAELLHDFTQKVRRLLRPLESAHLRAQAAALFWREAAQYVLRRRGVKAGQQNSGLFFARVYAHGIFPYENEPQRHGEKNEE